MEKTTVCPPACDSIAKDVEKSRELVIDIPPEWPECCIYRVPKHLRMVNEPAYTPKLVSIGPFHHIHRADELKDMEKHKQRYLKHFLEKRTQKSKEDLLKIIEKNEVKIRHSYSEDCGIESGDFVNMILLDAVFIIELFLKTEKEESDYILSKPWLGDGILHDLILLENQLPFFVLKKLYRFACCDEGQQTKDLKKEANRRFVKLSCNYFERYDKKRKLINEEVKHFTDLLRYLFLPSDKKSKGSEKQSINYTRFCATKADHAGLKFKAVDSRLPDKSGSRCGGCINMCFIFSCIIACLPCFICCLFTRRTLRVPQLVIDDNTEIIFRNLMALEQCHYPFHNLVCSYILLLDRLIDSNEDVDLLVQEKVIVHHLGSNTDVVSLINNLGLQIVKTQSSHFNYIDKTINDHYEYPLNRAMATVKREYFPNIFRCTATVVGLIVLFFTFWNFFKPLICRLELKYMCYN